MPKMTINPIYTHSTFVYHVTDPYKYKGVVVYYEVHPSGLKYAVSFGGDVESFHAFELDKFTDEIEKEKKQETDEDTDEEDE